MQGPISRAQIREDLKALGYTKISIRTHTLVRNRAKVYVQKDGVELVGDHNVYPEDYFQAARPALEYLRSIAGRVLAGTEQRLI
jgi:hypothetical protein